MDKTRERIQRGGKILNILCKVIRIILIVALCISVISTLAVFIVPGILEHAKDLFSENLIFQGLDLLADLKEMEEKYRVAIGGAITSISLGVLLFYVNLAEQLLGYLARGEQPFTLELAKRIRKAAYALFLLLLYNPVLGIILPVAALLISYLVEYGSYLREKAEETNWIQEEMIVSFAEITENKSGQTGQHIKRVSEYAKILAQELGMSETQVENVRLASTMHDVGKLLIPSEILEKPGRLTDEEYAMIKQHTTYGGQLLDHVEGDVMELSRTIALQHHERADGKGYPQGLDNADISLEGRIVAVADVYDALTSKRSYKDAWDDRQAYDEIVKGKGTQFDTEVVEAFQASYDKINQVRQQYADL